MDAYWFRWALGVSEMSKKRLTCSICKKKQWGLIGLIADNIEFGLCNNCFEIWDGVNAKLGVPIKSISERLDV